MNRRHYSFLIGFGLVALPALSSCVYIVASNTILPPEKMVSCQPIPNITLPAIPDVPVLTDKDLRDRDRVDTIMVNKIKELRDWAKNAKHEIEVAQERQRLLCPPM